MTDLTRRSFLKQTSVGAATLGLLSSLPALAAIPDSPQATKSEVPAAAFSGPMIAHVSDVATGEVALLVGAREFIFHDPQLVARLMKAAS
ncbi:MAG: twin-arginine translocation signal domain-containing protein [Verrucomicrobia bacterium]|nr:twin-arginine translocation signal domain-containing protein [Verrucomicrobiota bacterium]